MAVGYYKCVVVLNALNGLPEDAAINDFYFGSVSVGSHDADANLIQAMLANFYNGVGTLGADPLATDLSESITRTSNGCQVLYYFTTDLSAPVVWGSPVEVRSWTLGAVTAGTPMAREIAACASYHADLTNVPETAPGPGSTIIRPASRRRGRLYIGPLQATAGTEDGTSHELRLSAGFTNKLLGAMEELFDNSAASDFAWNVFSPTAEEMNAVVGGYVDNAFDVQRRRGLAPTSRTTWTG